jgi:hypothetical protein
MRLFCNYEKYRMMFCALNITVIKLFCCLSSAYLTSIVSIQLFVDLGQYRYNFLELKKLVYLYLMNYAKSQPDMAIMAVNTFVKDCEVSNLPILYPYHAVLADPA